MICHLSSSFAHYPNQQAKVLQRISQDTTNQIKESVIDEGNFRYKLSKIPYDENELFKPNYNMQNEVALIETKRQIKKQMLKKFNRSIPNEYFFQSEKSPPKEKIDVVEKYIQDIRNSISCINDKNILKQSQYKKDISATLDYSNSFKSSTNAVEVKTAQK